MTYLTNDTISLSANQSHSTDWRDIPGHDGFEINLISHEIRHKTTRRLLKQNTAEYIQCSIGRIHRLLVSAAIGRKLKKSEQVCHKDGNRYNNNISNLYLGTAKDNAKDKIAHNTNGIKLDNNDVYQIRDYFGQKSFSWIAKTFSVSESHIQKIYYGYRWAGLE